MNYLNNNNISKFSSLKRADKIFALSYITYTLFSVFTIVFFILLFIGSVGGRQVSYDIHNSVLPANPTLQQYFKWSSDVTRITYEKSLFEMQYFVIGFVGLLLTVFFSFVLGVFRIARYSKNQDKGKAEITLIVINFLGGLSWIGLIIEIIINRIRMSKKMASNFNQIENPVHHFMQTSGVNRASIELQHHKLSMELEELRNKEKHG